MEASSSQAAARVTNSLITNSRKVAPPFSESKTSLSKKRVRMQLARLKNQPLSELRVAPRARRRLPQSQLPRP